MLTFADCNVFTLDDGDDVVFVRTDKGTRIDRHPQDGSLGDVVEVDNDGALFVIKRWRFGQEEAVLDLPRQRSRANEVANPIIRATVRAMRRWFEKRIACGIIEP